MEECNHEIIDRYTDGAAECAMCGRELGVAGLMLKHLGIELPLPTPEEKDKI